jgi:hypothetical protein
MLPLKTWHLACVVVCHATTAFAAISGIGGALISGSSSFQGYVDYPTNTIPSGLTGYIEYAVFAPDTFPTGVGQFTGYTPTAGEYVYLYQAFVTGSAPLSGFSVEVNPSVDNIGVFTGLGVSGQSPTASYFFPILSPTSANWDFSGVTENDSSIGLAYSSPYGPIMLAGSTIDDGTIAEVPSLPSPAPEPGTLAFWSFGVVIFGVYRWRCGGRLVGV